MNSHLFIIVPRLLTTLCLCLAIPAFTLAQGDTDPRSEQVERVVQRAVGYLLTQQHESGCISEFRDRQNRRDNHRRRDIKNPPRHATAMTSLAIMAMAAVGHQPADPTPEGEAMRRGLEFILAEGIQSKEGYFGQADGSRMYGHGITTLMLSEMLGHGVDAEMDARIRESCGKAIDLILEAQAVNKSKQHRGGWRYEPHSQDADISVTVWQLMALRASKNSGIKVPKKAIDDAIAYIRRCYYGKQDKDGNPEGEQGEFTYEAGGGQRHTSTSAAGILSLQVCGAYEAPEIPKVANWLLEHPPKWGESWFFYGTYYFSQGMWQRGGEFASTARGIVEEILLEKQEKEGSWMSGSGNESDAGRIYATSMALLSLSVQHHFLPIYQK